MTISKFKISNRVLSVLLCLALLLSLVPLSPLTAAAATTNKNIMLGTGHVTGDQASNVYFGTYQQSSNGSGGYNVDPIKWRVLSNTDGKLFLLSDQNLDAFEYHKESEWVTWETSTMRSWLNGLANNQGNGDNAIDYADDNFLDTAFSASEQEAIAVTEVVNSKNPDWSTDGGSNTTDKVFLLSIAEARNTTYGFDYSIGISATRKATNTAYVAGGGKIKSSSMSGVGEAESWWLRSPGDNPLFAAYVYSYNTIDGKISMNGTYVNTQSYAVRPALNINPSKVLFTSAAVGGKVGGFNAVSDYSGTDWKLTLLDSGRSAFNATLSNLSNNTVTVSYSGAKTGTNEYISAIIKNGSTVKYYGVLQLAAESGAVTVTLPDDFSAANGDVLCIFNEQHNGDNKTDYASALKEMPIYDVAFDANGGTGTMNSVMVTGTYTLPANGFNAKDGYKFIGWATSANGTVISDTAITVTENITLYAVWEALPAEAPMVVAGDDLTLTYNDYTNKQVKVTVNEQASYNYTYQWYDGSGQPISNATGSTYTLPTDLTADTHYYYCRVTAQRTDNNLTDFTDSTKITVTVQKATPTVTSPVAKTNLVYNEAEQELIDAGSATNGTMQYALGTNDTTAPTDGWSTDIPKAKNAGTYYVWCKVVGNANYSDVGPTRITVTVNRANATLKTPTPSITYGEELGDATLPSGWTWADENTVPTMVNTGYTAYYTPADTANYNWSGVSGWDEEKNRVERTVPVTVEQKTIGIVWSNTEFTYDGTEKMPTATATYTVNDESITLTVGVTGNKSPIDAGSYTATVTGITGEHKDNYKLPGGIDCDFKIVNAGQEAPKATDFTVTDESAPDRKDGKIGGLTAAMEYSTAADGTYTPVTDTDMTFAAGTYYIRYGAKTNYNPSEPTAVTVNVLGKITVTFVADGVIIDTAFVDYGTDVDMSEIEQIPEKKGYTAAWDKDGKNITEATTITAVYTVNKFTGTESTEKVKDITSENVKPEDKTDLENAKEDLEDALKGDYTDEVKEEIQKEIDRINEALDVIDRVEKVEDMIEKLPDTITKDDIDDVEAAKKAYDELSDYEKTLVDPALKEKLDAAIKAAEALSKPSGSTSSGGTSSGSTSPDTGDNTNLWLWGSLLLVSGGAVIILTVYDRKKRAAQK